MEMSDLISRRDAINAIDDFRQDFINHYLVTLTLKNLPSLEPERKKGTWGYSPTDPEDAYCSRCGFHVYVVEVNFDSYHFCPHCGAEMTRGE